ncbi:MAG: YbhB/YbcL family Raf kinase inhibitor-like protein [Proteobacteria bacterium]|nr:YbhB/YbcL family Raf kinase inhibitor-like protein [Pseudomonadota bacterium]
MGAIPATYVAKNGGGNQSPPLQWKNPPAGTGSFAIQMVDLDFQTPPFIHWLIVNIPATSTQLPAAIPAGNNLAAPAEALGANQSKNYAGPNPPALHRYEWTVYAIKQGQTLTLGTNSATNKTELESKSLGKASLIGTYQ